MDMETTKETKKTYSENIFSLLKIIKKYWLSILVFLISTFVFIYQRSLIHSWDFSVYIMNARYLFYDGTYFELYRAPMVPFLLAIFNIFTESLGKYLFVIFVSILFFISSVYLGKVLRKKLLIKIKEEVFVFFSLYIIFKFFYIGLWII